ncbi:MAG TPA: YfhO family protein [Acidimicrobiales bacterium]|nr:YfhO family protein [Acidimicrobiales bacterium]
MVTTSAAASATRPPADPAAHGGDGAATAVGGGPWARAGTWVALGAVVLWGLVKWRAELNAVAYLDDSSVHEQMVRFALRRFQAGHVPLTSWFPYLGLGSPHFLHYQGLGAMLTGLLGMATGGDAAFRLTLYLLLALWPLPVYCSARVFGLSRATSVLAAAASPFLASAVGVGYEPKAYVWIGYGVWAQLWAAWALPLAWGFTWRAMTSRRAVLPAALFVTLTIALHFETGYLALLPIGIFPFLAPGPLRGRLGRAAAVAAGSLLASAWVTIPVIVDGRWAATNEILAHGPLVNGYGARQVLSWLVSGQVYDAQRFPVVTLLAAVGLVVCVARWRTDHRGRAVVVVWAMSLVLSFGRTTFGSLTVLLPGSTDIFMRRFMMGAQLAALYLAGMGGVALARAVAAAVTRVRPGVAAWAASPGRRLGLVVAAGAAGAVALAPAWSQTSAFASRNAQAVGAQRAAERARGPEIGRLIAYVRGHGGGRVYAGMPSNWGSQFTVGVVPVFKYLESRDVDEVGYTLRTASLMTDPEFFFDETNPGDYPLFGVRYMILPAGMSSPVPARLVEAAGPYRLWVLPEAGYVRVVDTVGVLSADRTDVGLMSVPYLRSDLPGAARYLAVAYSGGAPAPLTAPVGDVTGSPGRVRDERDDLPEGRVTATVVARRSAVVVLSASYDPGWTVRVDGHPVAVEMLAPALPGVAVGPGVHRVTFSYAGFRSYPALIAVGAVTLAALVWVGPLDGLGALRARRRRVGGPAPVQRAD